MIVRSDGPLEGLCLLGVRRKMDQHLGVGHSVGLPWKAIAAHHIDEAVESDAVCNLHSREPRNVVMPCRSMSNASLNLAVKV